MQRPRLQAPPPYDLALPPFHTLAQTKTVNRRCGPLPVYSLQCGAAFFRPKQALPERLVIRSPAPVVMTDLRRTPAVTLKLHGARWTGRAMEVLSGTGRWKL
ncbi:MAG: hypothetical protein ACYDDO_11675 [Acidiferrobacterales bacterium]